jgi:hypothetical protein
LRAAAREDRRFALLAAIDAAMATDKGLPIGEAVFKSFRDRGVLLPSAERMDRIGRAGRAIARKRALQAILNGRPPAQLAALDALLVFDSAIPPNAIWLARRLVGFSGHRQSQRPSRSR